MLMKCNYKLELSMEDIAKLKSQIRVLNIAKILDIQSYSS